MKRRNRNIKKVMTKKELIKEKTRELYKLIDSEYDVKTENVDGYMNIFNFDGIIRVECCISKTPFEYTVKL